MPTINDSLIPMRLTLQYGAQDASPIVLLPAVPSVGHIVDTGFGRYKVTQVTHYPGGLPVSESKVVSKVFVGVVAERIGT